MDILKRLIVNEDGQGVIEYTLMVGLVVLVIWAAIFTFGIPNALNSLWATVSGALNNPTVAPS
jgi:Flp pilus assembly pilin Flp